MSDLGPGLFADAARALVADLHERHGATTIIVYGSRARGQGRPDSDLDVLALRPGSADAPEERDSRIWRGVWLDAFVASEMGFAVSESYLRLEGGRVLVDAFGRGAAILAEVEALLRRGPQPAPGILNADRDWLLRMLDRVAVGGVLGDARRAQLQEQLLPMWFALRGGWFRGLPAALATLEREAPEDLAVLAAALRSGAGLPELRAAVALLTG